MPQLDNYLVTLGVKGQNVVLATMDKIQRKGKNLSKSKTTVDLASKAAGKKSVTEKATEKKEAEKAKQTRKQENEDNKKNTSKFREAVGRFGQGAREAVGRFGQGAREAVGRFGQGAQTIAGSAAGLDPTALISGMTTAIGTSLSGISILGFGIGRLPEGIAAITNSMLSMAKNSVDMAQQSTAAYHALATRNAAAEHYGGNIRNDSPLSNNERAMFIDAVSGSMGKIQEPLAEQINKLMSTKDTRALARAAAGDWESTGTDKGWMLGQISGSLQGLPPSARQKIQASLLKNFSGEIQDMSDARATVQMNARDWANMGEEHTKTLYEGSVYKDSGRTDANVIGIATKLNTMQEGMYTAGLGFAEAVNKTADAIASLPKRIMDFKDSLEKLLNSGSIKEAAKNTGGVIKNRPVLTK